MPHRNWQQANAAFPDRSTAGHLFATQGGPVLRQAEADGAIASWFFLLQPQWRLRWLPASPAANGHLPQHAGQRHPVPDVDHRRLRTRTACLRRQRRHDRRVRPVPRRQPSPAGLAPGPAPPAPASAKSRPCSAARCCAAPAWTGSSKATSGPGSATSATTSPSSPAGHAEDLHSAMRTLMHSRHHSVQST